LSSQHQQDTTNKYALFLKAKHIGDSIILTSAIESLPEDYQVDVLCFKDSAPVFKMHPKVRAVFVVPRDLQGWSRWKSYWDIYQHMRYGQYQLLAQFSDDWRGAFLSRLLRTPMSVARGSHKRPKFWKDSFKKITRLALSPRPAAEQDVDLIRLAGLYKETTAPAYVLKPGESEFIKVNEWLDQFNFSEKKIVLLHAAARWKFKGWKKESWANLIDHLHAAGHVVIMSGSKSDLFFNQMIIDQCVSKPILVQNFSLAMTASLMARVHLLISIDSMSIHMASAMKKPIVALFGPTDDRVWGPWKTPHIILPSNQNLAPSFLCRPCGLDGCAGTKISQCLYAITTEDVLAAAKQFLD